MKRLGLWIVGIALLAAVGYAASQHNQKKEQAQTQLNAQSERLQKAETMFAERCKTAGEKIRRTVEDVEGIYLLKLRQEQRNRSDQFALDDPYGDDLNGEGYIVSFLRGSIGEPYRANWQPGKPPRIGYFYVEADDPMDGKRYRYTGRIEEPWQYDKNYLQGHTRFVMDKAPAPGEPPRYGVTYDDLSTHEEREYWIAGSSLKVIDMQTKEVIAERIGYMMDRGQGSDAGGRSPWMMAADNACPSFNRFQNPVVNTPGFSKQGRQTQDFVEKVLHPKVKE